MMLRSAISTLIIAIGLSTSGCSFSPVYGDGSAMATTGMAFDLGEPNTRLEQVVYQELALRFSTSTAPNTPKLAVTTRSSRGNPFRSQNPGLTELREASVIATAVVTIDGKELFRAERRASARYTMDKQVLADRTAAIEAEERAAKAAAESLRLALLANFSRDGAYR